ncbi:MAG: DUF308 domain-containing protein [Pseudomonadota bacterium]
MANKFLWILMSLLSIVGGVIALMNPVFASGVATLFVAWMFIIFGILQVIAGFRIEGAGAKIWSILLGALATYLGITILGHPLKGMLALTSMIAILCLSVGIAKTILSFSLEDRRFFWLVLVSGLASIAVGLIIFMSWPVSAVTALGILLGIQLLSDGAASLAMALSTDGEEAKA